MFGLYAIVADIRREQGRRNAVVYGCVTDSYQVAFPRLDSQFQYSIWLQNWGRRAMTFLHRSERRIYTHLRMITKMTTNPSPRTSAMMVRQVYDRPNDDRSYHRRFTSDEEMT